MGFICDEAEDGVKATEMAQIKQYALILMDNVMPRMTGVEATKKVEEKGRGLVNSGPTCPLVNSGPTLAPHIRLTPLPPLAHLPSFRRFVPTIAGVLE